MKTSSLIQALSGTSLASALLASVAVHVTAFALLMQVAGWSRVGDSELPDRDRTLEATLVAPANPTASASLSPIVSPIATAKALDRTEQPPATPKPGAIRETSRINVGGAERRAGANRGHVVISDKRPRSDFGPEIEGQAIMEFPAEIQGGVDIPEGFFVDYPPEALAEGREASVLVWIVVNAEGRVEATHFIAGSPGFTEAVEAALATARFGPAINDHHPIRFYTTLSFEFRLDAGTGNASATAR